MTSYLARPELARHASDCHRRSVDSGHSSATLVTMMDEDAPPSEATPPRKRRPSLMRAETYSSKVEQFKGWRWRNPVVYLSAVVVVAIFAICCWAGYRSSLSNFTPRYNRHDPVNPVSIGATHSLMEMNLEAGVIVSGVVQSFNLDTLRLSIEWQFLGSGQYAPSCIGQPQPCVGQLGVDAVVVADGEARISGSFSAASERNAYITQRFATKEFLYTNDGALSASTGAARYPFDKYLAQLQFVVLTPDLNSSLPFVAMVLQNNLPGLVLSSWDAPLNMTTPTAFWPGGRGLVIAIERAIVIRVVASGLVTISWMIALTILYLTVLLAGFRKQIPVGFVPMMATSLFALPALRAIQPGNPPIGTLGDVCGFLIQEIICAVCLCASVVTYAARSSLPTFKST